ncbi:MULTISPECIES: DUF2934 domain-containing protein [unclassified Azospirillum]|uniref:DUF2934 domain-containing protein n=1 Tax=unclassified Azospirillum TaxID=2630922 RepID=UPI000B67067C|nr:MULTISPECIES: DUF2934 domain-containing protein [unclassified Azospirillum]SNS88699.1 Protein of unknown function [Azospirillum sp. RU38E]SNT05821.1 Protein of unknown function [Azospirillum sp. RU37A]
MQDEDRIRQRAHEIWEREGRPLGADQHHWARARQEIAEEDLRARAQAAGSATAPPPEQQEAGRLFQETNNPRLIGNADKGIVSDGNDTLISTERQGLPAEQTD